VYSVKTITKIRQPTSEITKAKDRLRQATYRAEKRYGSTTELSKRSQHMKRIRALMLLGGKCDKCGNNDMRTLHIDHVNNDGAAHRRETNRNVVQWVFKSPERFQILCANCHEIKHTKYFHKE
jgi:hypothetical protein